MFGYLIPIVFGLALLSAVVIGSSSQKLETSRQANAQIDKYKAFLYGASVYFKATAAPATTTAYGWSSMASAMPSAMQGMSMPSFWKAVRQPDGSWVACTELTETAAAALPTLFPSQTTTVGVSTVPSLPKVVAASAVTSFGSAGAGGSTPGAQPDFVVVGQDATTALASANLCAGI